MRRSMNVVPFKAPESFTRFGIDWTRDAKTESLRRMDQRDQRDRRRALLQGQSGVERQPLHATQARERP